MTTTIGSLDLSALNNLYDETQYFWFESSAQPWGAGAHVTLYPQSEFTTSTHANYLKGQNILMNTDGFSLRNGTLPMMTLDNDSLDFNVVNTTAGTYETTATFTATSARIGAIANGQSRTEITSSGIDLIRRNNYGTDYILSHNGYGTVTNSSGTTTTGAYVTFFGTPSGYTPGLYSFSAGSAWARGYHSTAFGDSVTADGRSSFVAGEDSRAIANYSVALNLYNDAKGECQTVIGQYCNPNTTSAFIIGNGSNSQDLSNALTVDWSGNVNIASGAKYKINGTNLSANDVGALPLSGGTMTGQIKTSYRESVAMGSYGSSQSTVDGLVEEVRYSSGCMGSTQIKTAYTANGVTIAIGWYNFLWMPHRSGGVNGSASGDNCNYGQLLLFGMNNTNGRFIVRVSSGTIQEVAKIYTSVPSDTATALYKVTTMTITVPAINAHNYASAESKSIPSASQVSGYNCVGIVGRASTNFRIVPHTCYVESNSSVYVGFHNDSASNVTTTTTTTLHLLWLKATSA